MESVVKKTEGPMVLPRAFSLLKLLAASHQGHSLSSIATHLDVPKSSLSSTLKALTEQRMISRTGTLYTLGTESVTLASAILAGQTLRQIARPYLEQAMETTGETVVLAELDADEKHVIYVDAVESTKAVRFCVRIGTRRPLYATSLGQIFLANLPKRQRDAYINSTVLDNFTDNTISNRADLENVLSDIRENDLAVAYGHVVAEVAGFAVPVRNSEGHVVASLAIGVPVSRAKKEESQCIEALVETGVAISRALGYRQD